MTEMPDTFVGKLTIALIILTEVALAITLIVMLTQ
jgi:hypothetical protein